MNYLITNLLLAILLVLILSIISVVLVTLTAAVWLSKEIKLSANLTISIISDKYTNFGYQSNTHSNTSKIN